MTSTLGPGRRSLYADDHRGDTRQSRPFYMDMTPQGRAALARLRRATGLSRNNIIAHLAMKYADYLTFEEDPHPFPGKLAKNSMSVRVPKSARKKLRAAHARTKHSYADIGEALVRWYGVKETHWPTLPPPLRERRSPAPKPPTVAHHVITAEGTQTFFTYDDAATAMAQGGGVLVSSKIGARKAAKLVALAK